MPELHPEASAFLETVDALPQPPRYALTVESAREALRELFADAERDAEVEEMSEFTIPGPVGNLPVRLYTPRANAPHPTLVFYHGGGWVVGDLDTHDNVCRALCAGADCAVVSVDYRLAPEHPFPAAVEDAYAALKWVAEHGEGATLDTDRLAVGGDSAGGNLAAATALLARDRNGPALTHQSLIYPAVASMGVQEFPSYEENGRGYLLEMPGMEWYWERYVQSRVHERNPYLAPLLASDHSDLPPATVLTAGFDPLRDEGQAYADRLEAAGVPVERHHHEGQIHGFVSLTDFMSSADDALDDLAADLRTAFEA
ncbi:MULTISPECIES: alpha/beta hydrolase [Halorussus]|uniref:alpha/beta hydrolase n=1 Tax=Halorussus TaxID=1070314 RepID=UPI00209E4ACF|nr:alpha/beta hydrolase [Halorussus vallis]USZ75022.1 alpha/beta hydrolase [Halorussus vallis]